MKTQIRKIEQYQAFIKTLKDGNVAHWVDIAKALGVDQDTITAWKRLPEAQEAIKQGINEALEEMKVAGKKDWRMWQERLRMLGAVPQEKPDTNLIVVSPFVQLMKMYGYKEGESIGELPTSDKDSSEKDS